jgi:flagellar basal body rod protein FlgG
MNVSLYQAASALNATARWQEMIAQNLAASSLPGFKKQDISFAAIQSGLLPAAQTGGSANILFPGVNTSTNFIQAELRATGAPTDLAIEGNGFFQVQLPTGDIGYTRDGEFRIDDRGQLVTKQGYSVLGNGAPIQLDINNHNPLTISANGEISQGTEVKGRITVTSFNNPQLLQSTANGYFVARDPNLLPTPSPDARLYQGYLETANTTPVAEMNQLITAMRQFEANQRVLQIQDERLGRLIAELGNPSI